MQHHGEALADADADRRDAVAAAAAAQLVRQRAEDPRAGGAEWMPDRDRASIDVDALRIEVGPLSNARERLSGEGLVELDHFHITPRDTRARERRVRGLHGRDPEDVRIDGVRPAGDDPGERLPGICLVGEDEGTGTVLSGDELPAVTVPSFTKAGLSFASFSSELSGRTLSSRSSSVPGTGMTHSS